MSGVCSLQHVYFSKGELAGHPALPRNVMLLHLQAWQQQPPPFLQQQRPLRRLPTTPAEVAQTVQQKVVGMCQLSQHGQGDMQDIQNLMNAALLNVSVPATLHSLRMFRRSTRSKTDAM